MRIHLPCTTPIYLQAVMRDKCHTCTIVVTGYSDYVIDGTFW